MIIKYCSNCTGSPYTEDLGVTQCPVCNSILLTEMVNDRANLSGRPKLPVGFGAFDGGTDTGAFDTDSWDTGNGGGGAFDDMMNDDTHGSGFSENDDTDSGRGTFSDVDEDDLEVFPSQRASKSSGSGVVCIRGKVSQYTTVNGKTGQYRRLLPRKIWQAIKYGQRFEDVLHSFTVTENNGRDAMGYSLTNTYVVNVHGSTNYGASIVDNEEVEVKGQFTHDNILMAREVKVINGNAATPVKFQRSVKLIAVFCIIAALLLLGLFAISNAAGGAMTNIWNFIVTMFAVYVILLILYLVASFTRLGFMVRLLSGGRSRKSPTLVMLIIAFVLTLLLYNVFGIGTAIGNMLVGALGVVGPIIFMVIGIVILLKAIIK